MDGLVNLLAARILSFSHSTFFFSNTGRGPLSRLEIYRLMPKRRWRTEVLEIGTVATQLSRWLFDKKNIYISLYLSRGK